MIIPIYAAIAGLLISQAAAQAAISPCAAGCVDGSFANAASVGCGVGDLLCMCGHTVELQNGVRDCFAQACAAENPEQLTLADAATNERCVAASAAAGAVPTTTADPAVQPTTTEPPPEPTTETTAAPTTAEPVPETTTTSPTVGPESASTSALSTSTPVSTSASSATSTTTSASSTITTKASSTSSASPSTTNSEAPSTGTDSAEQTEESESAEAGAASGLSIAAKAGIGAGIGVAVIMAAIIAICLVVRRKQKENDSRRAHNMLEISNPLPGGGRQWADEGKVSVGASVMTNSPDRSSYSSDLDRHARRYEDMLPHTKPHTMI